MMRADDAFSDGAVVTNILQLSKVHNLGTTVNRFHALQALLSPRPSGASRAVASCRK